VTSVHNPAPGRPITSGFGSRVHPFSGRRSHHRGVDYGGSFPVLAAADGVVVKVGASLSKTSGFGHYLILEHAALGLRSLYAHGAHPSRLRTGDTVKGGTTIIFTSGSTGASTGNHLHFEIHRRNQFRIWTPVNPAQVLLSFASLPAVPIKPIPRRNPKVLSITRITRKGVGEHLMFTSASHVSMTVELSTAKKEDREFWFRVARELANASGYGPDYLIPTIDDSNNGGWFMRNQIAHRIAGMPADFPLSPTRPYTPTKAPDPLAQRLRE
jgi:hypothetical protein